MAGTVNKATILGNVGKDPEIRSFPNGGKVANFSVATSESWKDKQSGEKREKTEWHRISVMNEALVNIVEKYVRKGSKVYLEGQIETRKWTDKDGAEKYSTEIVLRPFNGSITLLDSKGGKSNDESTAGQEQAYEAAKESATGGGGFNDEIPFDRFEGSL